MLGPQLVAPVELDEPVVPAVDPAGGHERRPIRHRIGVERIGAPKRISASTVFSLAAASTHRLFRVPRNTLPSTAKVELQVSAFVS